TSLCLFVKIFLKATGKAFPERILSSQAVLRAVITLLFYFVVSFLSAYTLYIGVSSKYFSFI
ncbi:MAG: hypothetical protein K2P63_10965, partial [Lachnospiraceae bacterium]|nr:hypothetical protein [Lachnospiraceae bacterium]